MGQQSGWQASLAALQQQLPLLQLMPDSSLAAGVLGALLVLLLIPRLRCLVWDTVETILASLLLVVLVLLVLGLAPGAAYITYRGVMFVVRSLGANFPQIEQLAALLHQAVDAVKTAISR
ncbi:hypothetical protein COO60DRAFT_1477470 [Scenedesmus sp. NREL 46B-D3]|nr:hypothetical protein COO60DRAFT_1477470 [Scenedesmus sp. NREL 46B-D3]